MERYDTLQLIFSVPVTRRLRAEKIRGNSGMIELRATLTILYRDSLAKRRTRTSGSSRQFRTGETRSSTNLSVSYKKTNIVKSDIENIFKHNTNKPFLIQC